MNFRYLKLVQTIKTEVGPISVAFASNLMAATMTKGIGQNGNVMVYKFNDDGIFTLIQTVETSQYPNNIAFSSSGKVAAVTNYNSNNIGVYSLTQNGLTEIQNIANLPSKPISLSFARITDNIEFAIVGTESSDIIVYLGIDQNTGKLSQVQLINDNNNFNHTSIAVLPVINMVAITNCDSLSKSVSIYEVNPNK